jgi:hypothetical protein
MRPTLPSDFGRKAWLFLLFACHHADAPVAPGEPIPAEPDVVVDTMDKECDGLLAALDAYGECPNSDEADKEWVKSVVKISQESFDAGKKGNPDADAQKVIAHACHRAAMSVKHATERCMNGKKPIPDY